ncbi:hypothetical protein [Mesorhizobium sp. M0633]|uniref:hypothetical protein n=1 Tax=Mesorhizobium sp. M0633 TaxID=2956977 RepID=UPI003335FEF1
MDSQPWPIADCASRRTFAAMVAEHVELALFEQSLGKIEGLHRPFCDRVADAAEKTAGSVLFDVRVDGDICVQRMAAIGYGVTGTAIIVMDKTDNLDAHL